MQAWRMAKLEKLDVTIFVATGAALVTILVTCQARHVRSSVSVCASGAMFYCEDEDIARLLLALHAPARTAPGKGSRLSVANFPRSAPMNVHGGAARIGPAGSGAGAFSV
jgi:hypothetical protein